MTEKTKMQQILERMSTSTGLSHAMNNDPPSSRSNEPIMVVGKFFNTWNKVTLRKVNYGPTGVAGILARLKHHIDAKPWSQIQLESELAWFNNKGLDPEKDYAILEVWSGEKNVTVYQFLFLDSVDAVEFKLMFSEDSA